MGFAVEIMTKEEAMALPVEKRPICYRISEAMYMACWEAVGSAAGCWKTELPKDQFLPEKASEVAMELAFKIADEVEAAFNRGVESTKQK